MPTQDPLKRLKCAYDECHNDRKYYCFDHKLRLCSDCCDSLHYNCTVQAIRSKDELWNAVGLLHHFVASLTKKANAYKLMENISGLADCMKHISSLFEAFEQEARIAMKKDQFLKFHLLIEEARKIKSDILGGNFGRVRNYEQGSNPILRLLFDSELVGLTYSKIGAVQKKSIRKSPEFEETVREVTTEFKDHIEAKTKKEIQEKTKEIEEKTEAKYQKQIQDLQEDNKNSEEKVKAVEKAVTELTNKIKEQQDLIGREQIQKEDFEKELSALMIQHNQLKTQHEDIQKVLEDRQKELEEKDKDLKHVKGSLCEAMYKDIVGAAKTFDSNAKLEIALGNEKHRKLIEAYAQNKVKLPDIKRVFIKSIKDIPLESLDQFLKHSIPDQLPLLCLNWSWEELLVGAKVMDGLKDSLLKITKEIFLFYTEFQPLDLEVAFKNSINSERLCIVACKVHTKEKMNFGSKQAKTTYLSFSCCCGDSKVTMDWGNHPERFENIIEAISKSPYKNSLQTLNTNKCNLSKSKVEEMLSKYNMSFIKVIEESPCPLSD
ncbi:unnamed protein product [Moneuplotes crassus]|uniref:Uncharacterized protein n=1 Tax=Euplotes crassus TaxID=5936 RepID=A0AAD1UAV1_EUPCR|nr:unnamed protein product [Moneuplotes crassus]